MTDRGSGIPPDDLERVFDKFYRVHRPDNVSGTGLGLSICKGIVEAHGGRIWAENLKGSGLKVSFTLPLHPAFTSATMKAEEPAVPFGNLDGRPPPSMEALVQPGRNHDE